MRRCAWGGQPVSVATSALTAGLAGKQATVTDDSLQISHVQGLQTALDEIAEQSRGSAASSWLHGDDRSAQSCAAPTAASAGGAAPVRYTGGTEL